MPLVRRWLRAGVSLAKLRSSVGVQDVSELAGRLKSPVVGSVTVKLQVIVKQGSDELLKHQDLMREVNQRAQGVRSSILVSRHRHATNAEGPRRRGHGDYGTSGKQCLHSRARPSTEASSMAQGCGSETMPVDHSAYCGDHLGVALGAEFAHGGAGSHRLP